MQNTVYRTEQPFYMLHPIDFSCGYLFIELSREKRKKSAAYRSDVKRDFIFAMACPMPHELLQISFQRLCEPTQHVSISSLHNKYVQTRYARATICAHCAPPCIMFYLCVVSIMDGIDYSQTFNTKMQPVLSNYRGHL